MLDDYQDCGTRPVDVKAMNLDFYLTGTLKYLLGPPGLAFLYVRKELISSLAPTITDGSGRPIPSPIIRSTSTFPDGAKIRDWFSISSQCDAAMPGFQMLEEIGMEEVAGHVENLAQLLFNRTRELGNSYENFGRDFRAAGGVAVS